MLDRAEQLNTLDTWRNSACKYLAVLVVDLVCRDLTLQFTSRTFGLVLLQANSMLGSHRMQTLPSAQFDLQIFEDMVLLTRTRKSPARKSKLPPSFLAASQV